LHARSDDGDWGLAPRPGDVLPDAPLHNGADTWATEAVAGRFAAITFVDEPGNLSANASLAPAPGPLAVEQIAITRRAGVAPTGWKLLRDVEGLLARRCDARTGTTYLVRPDQVVAGRWRTLDMPVLTEALRVASGRAGR
jgi:3-(3-hydroxy-phenyl)propionate hydroxylase